MNLDKPSEHKEEITHGLYILIENPGLCSLGQIRDYLYSFLEQDSENTSVVQEVMLNARTREMFMKYFEPIDGPKAINAFLSEFEDIEKDPD